MFPALGRRLVGRGNLSAAQEEALTSLLLDKGVPKDALAERLKAAGNIAQALEGKNPWQLLKATASRPGVSFRWVTAEELTAHVEARAQERFGTSVPNAKAKNQK